MLRHATGYVLANKGTDTRTLQSYLRHRSIQSTGVYAKISDAKRERVAAYLELSREVAKIKTKRGRGGR